MRLDQVDEARINELIEIRLESRMKSYGKEISKTMKVIAAASLAEQSESIAKTFRDSAAEIFHNMEFIKKFKRDIHLYIQQELASQLSQEGMHKFITEKISFIMTYKMGDVIKSVVLEALDRINKKLERDLKRAKDLTLSIDSEIRHTMMDLPIAYKTEKMVTAMVMKMLAGGDFKKQLEQQNKSEDQKFLEGIEYDKK